MKQGECSFPLDPPPLLSPQSLQPFVKISFLLHREFLVRVLRMGVACVCPARHATFPARYALDFHNDAPDCHNHALNRHNDAHRHLPLVDSCISPLPAASVHVVMHRQFLSLKSNVGKALLHLGRSKPRIGLVVFVLPKCQPALCSCTTYPMRLLSSPASSIAVGYLQISGHGSWGMH